MIDLRDYQQEILNDLLSTSDNPCVQLDTGAGKSFIVSEYAKRVESCLVVVHTKILAEQISESLARSGVAHRLVVSKDTARRCEIRQRRIGINLLDSSSRKILCTVDSFNSKLRRGVIRSGHFDAIIFDEAHHVLRENKWGRLARSVSSGRIVGFTATPVRLDNKSLHVEFDGFFDRILQAKSLSSKSIDELISRGHLSDFKCYSMPSRIDESKLKFGSHDYTYKTLEKETYTVVYEIAGDAVKSYKKIACDKKAIAFCVSIRIAEKIMSMFRDAGISSACVHSKMGYSRVQRVFDAFRRGEIRVLCSVDMIGEGVDVPDVDCVIFLRKTASMGLYRQWCGRALRVAHGKNEAVIIDHVGNVLEHGLPNRDIIWNLKSQSQGGEKSNVVRCERCFAVNSAYSRNCKECGESILLTRGAEIMTDIKSVNIGLVEIEREKQSRAAREEAIRVAERSGITYKKKQSSSFYVNAVENLKITMLDHVSKHFSFERANMIHKLEKFKDDKFWIKNFSSCDRSSDKFLKVYKREFSEK